MSEFYIQRLRQVRDEFDALKFALAYINKNWHKNNIFVDSTSIPSKHLDLAERNLEKTYIIRLFSEFEGILLEYSISEGHSVPEKPGAEWLITKVSRIRKASMDPKLIRKVREV